jgi:hypothetical protein
MTSLVDAGIFVCALIGLAVLLRSSGLAATCLVASMLVLLSATLSAMPFLVASWVFATHNGCDMQESLKLAYEPLRVLVTHFLSCVVLAGFCVCLGSCCGEACVGIVGFFAGCYMLFIVAATCWKLVEIFALWNCVEAGHSCASLNGDMDWMPQFWTGSQLLGCPLDSSATGTSPASITVGVVLALEIVVLVICWRKFNGSKVPEESQIDDFEGSRENVEQHLPEIGSSMRWVVIPESDEERERRTGVSRMESSTTRFTVACKSGQPLQLISRLHSEDQPIATVPSQILHDFVWTPASVDASFTDTLEQYWGAVMMHDSSLPQIDFYDDDPDGDDLVPYQVQVDNWDTWKTVWDAIRDLVRDMKRAWWALHPGARDTPQIVANVRPKKASRRPQANVRPQRASRRPQASPGQQQTIAVDDGEGIIMPWGDEEWVLMHTHNTFLEVWEGLKQQSRGHSRSAPPIGRSSPV